MKKIVIIVAGLAFSIQGALSQIMPSASVPEADSRPLQVFTTALRVTVRDNLGNVVDSAEVQIFRTKEAYETGKLIRWAGCSIPTKKDVFATPVLSPRPTTLT